MSSGGKAILGSTWSSSLVRIAYDNRENEVDRRVSSNLETIIQENANLASPLYSKITKVASYSTDLDGCFPKPVSKIAKHHFIEIETES